MGGQHAAVALPSTTGRRMSVRRAFRAASRGRWQPASSGDGASSAGVAVGRAAEGLGIATGRVSAAEALCIGRSTTETVMIAVRSATPTERARTPRAARHNRAQPGSSPMSCRGCRAVTFGAARASHTNPSRRRRVPNDLETVARCSPRERRAREASSYARAAVPAVPRRAAPRATRQGRAA